MPQTIRFHLDENCAGTIVAGLMRRGLDVTTTAEVGLRGAHDSEQVAYALAARRVTFTQDSDFLGIHAAGVAHSGIVYCAKDSRTIGQVIDFLILICELIEADEMRNRLELIEYEPFDA